MSSTDFSTCPSFQVREREGSDRKASHAELWAYWNSLPKVGCVPKRADFEPMRLAKALPDIAILERIERDVWLVRVAGTRIVFSAGIDPTGKNYLDVVGEEHRQQVATVLSIVADTPCGYEGRREISLTEGSPVVVHTLMLPLRAANGDCRLLVSAHCREEPKALAGDSVLRSIDFLDRRLIDIGAGLNSAAAEAER